MTYYLKNGNTYRVTDEKAIDIRTALPAGNYIIKQDPFGNLFLEQIDDFVPLTKYYGNTLRHTDRILNTFMDRSNSTGVMLTGEKGSGKTLLAKNLSIEGYKRGMPTIVINNDWAGDAFNKLIQDIDQPTIILFDEFEKVYDPKEQEQVLTLLDGVFPSKKLFVLTCNDKWRVDRHMRNRPGRIFYMLDFKGLGQEFIAEYCEDNLVNKHYTEQVCKIAALFSEFNFDMLKALVEDMNRYNETPQEAMQMLNAKPEYESDTGTSQTFQVDLVVDDKKIDEKKLYTRNWHSNPLGAQRICIEYTDTDSDEDDHEEFEEAFLATDLKDVDAANGTFIYINGTGAKLKLTRKAPEKFDYFKLI